MRVIAGVARGRRLTAPLGPDTRPTSDRVKEALFSALALRLRGARVADLYAGSGALGIEALSRGAERATFVERARPAQDALSDNLARTGLVAQAVVLREDVAKALQVGLPGAPFDIVLIDPPYRVDPAELEEVLRLVTDVMVPGGVVVVELGRRTPPPAWPERLLPRRTRRYGDTLLHEAHAPATGEVGPLDPGEPVPPVDPG
ncbi:MAG: 16S rRNA (guanine(966)-N(2))-methyltransferase RsmD [Actinomycetota bacterium]|nr:16S rRNA (guanine(966)-N(2))-methyltransferase RsmD [Actinomycetota bacterium]